MTRRHVCACGATALCTNEPDRCEHGIWWTCDACLEHQMDDYFQQLQIQIQEPVDEPQQSV